MKEKKFMKAVLAIAFVFAVIFAKTDTVRAQEIIHQEVDEISASSMLYSTSKVSTKRYTLEPQSAYLIPVRMKNTGVIYMDCEVTGLGDDFQSDGVDIYLVDEDNAELIRGGNEFDYVKEGTGYFWYDQKVEKYGGIPVKKDELYYLYILNENEELTTNVAMKLRLYTTGLRTLKEGTDKWTLASAVDSKSSGIYQDRWFKIKAEKSGEMEVFVKSYSDYDGGNVTLYDKDKKRLSEELTLVPDWKICFGVKKGTTYYLKVSSASSIENYHKFGVRYKITSYTDRDLNTKSEAKTLKRKAKATNTLFTASRSTKSSATTDWYKIKVTSGRRTKIVIDTEDISYPAEFKITIYSGSKVNRTYTHYAMSEREYDIITNNKYYAPKGTYYVKIEKKSKYISGKYSIRYKQ